MSGQKPFDLLVALTLCTGTSAAVHAADSDMNTLADALRGGQPALDLRYRMEMVDQHGFSEDARASILRTRLGWKSGSYRGFSVKVEMDDLSTIGNESYNSTTNGKSAYPVVADPEGTEVNQAFLRYDAGDFLATAGRQRINLGDQRFVGGVGWRQNEQTYDGYRLRYGGDDTLQMDYSYIHNVNRLFGEDSDNGELKGDIQVLRTSYPLTENQRLTLLALELDLRDAVDASSRTLTVNYEGAFGPLTMQLGYARQTEAGDSSLNYSVPYYLAELGAQAGPLNIRLGVEQLGAEEGISFSTPLATLHKFQGFADQFLSTPADGVEDRYLGISGKLVGGALSLVYHQFSAVESSADWGDEWDLAYSRKLSRQLSATLKYAGYRAGEHNVDTDKLWLMITASF